VVIMSYPLTLLLLFSLLALISLPNKDEYVRGNNPDLALSQLQFRLSAPSEHLPNGPDTTVILLNWSRLPNVILIASVMCSPQLEGMVAQVFIWNNNPSYDISLRVCIQSPWNFVRC